MMTWRLRALVLIAVAMAFGPTGTSAQPVSAAEACPVSADVNVTLQALRAGCTQRELDTLYWSLPAGPMPGEVTARGWARTCDGCGRGGPLSIDRLLADQLWQGQIFHTTATGGYMTNRVLGGWEALFAYVNFGPSYVDGEEAIILTYPTNVSFLRGEIRQVQPGVYLGYAFVEELGVRFKIFNFILDTLHPELKPSDCLLCAFGPRPSG